MIIPDASPGEGLPRRLSAIRVDLVGLGLFALVLAGLSILLARQVAPEVFQGRLVEPDSYMRLVEVSRLVQTGDWYDHSIPRSNAPFGEVSHWTRPLDVLLLVASAPFLLFRRLEVALHLSALALPPLLLLLTCIAAAWAVVPIGGKEARPYAMIAALAQAGIVGYGIPGRPDHHILLVLLFVLAIGFSLRWMGPPFSPGAGLMGGVVSGVGVWVGPEFLLPLAVLFAVGAACWIFGVQETSRSNHLFAVGLCGMVALAVALEHPPGNWFIPEFDKVSAPHLLMAAIAVTFWALIPRFASRTSQLLQVRRRVIGVVLGGAVATGALALFYPDFFRGPTVAIDPRLEPIWFSLLEERVSLLPPQGLAGLGNLLTHVGLVGFTLPFAVWATWAGRREGTWGPWFLLSTSLMVLTVLAVVRIRFVPYPEILGALVIAVILGRLRRRFDPARSGLAEAFLRSLAAAALITGPLFLGFAFTVLGGRTAAGIRAGAQASAVACPFSKAVGWLADPDGMGGTPMTIATHVDYGPELLYRTRHRVLGTPYHRNAAGILAVFNILADPDIDHSRDVAEDRGVDLILICPLHRWIYEGGETTSDGSDPLFVRLVEGRLPEWAGRVSVPREVLGDMMLFEVDGSLTGDR